MAGPGGLCKLTAGDITAVNATPAEAEASGLCGSDVADPVPEPIDCDSDALISAAGATG